MIVIKDGNKNAAKGDTLAEAMVRLKDALPDALFYPHVSEPEIHVRLKGEDGEYHKVRVFRIEEV